MKDSKRMKTFGIFLYNVQVNKQAVLQIKINKQLKRLAKKL